MIQITFLKGNGDIIKRTRKTLTEYKKGEITSMGWKVLDIQYKYKDKYYSKADYDIIIDNEFKKIKKINEYKNKINYLYKHLAYFVSVMILFRILELSFNFVV